MMAQMTEIMVYQYNCPQCGGVYHSRLPLKDKTCHLCSHSGESWDCKESCDEPLTIKRYAYK